MDNIQGDFEKEFRLKIDHVCPKCSSPNTYFLVKVKGYRCRRCGNQFQSKIK